jgi:isopenicillin N synthase-like dioxygenase
MRKAQSVSEKLMICFARGLGFSDDYFINAHDVSRPETQTVLRLLHYFAVDESAPVPDGYYRAGMSTVLLLVPCSRRAEKQKQKHG